MGFSRRGVRFTACFLVASMANRAGAQERVVVEHRSGVWSFDYAGVKAAQSVCPEEQAVAALPPLNMKLARYLVIQALNSGKFLRP